VIANQAEFETTSSIMDDKKSRQTVKKYALASFLNDLGSDMIYPVWPLFITQHLGANMIVLGFVDGLGDAIVSISQAISGYLSDRLRKRKVFIWFGYVMGSISRLGYAFSLVWQQAIAFRILDRAGKIRSAPRDAAIADLSTKANRGGNFGLLRAMDNLGATFGVLICILFFNSLGYKNLFLIAAIPSVIAVFLIFFGIKDDREFKNRAYKGISFSHFNRNLWMLFLLSAIFSLGFFSYSFLLMYAKKAGFADYWIPILYLVFTATASVVSIPFGRLSDNIGRKKVMLISFLLWMVICLFFTQYTGFWSILFLFVLYGIQKGALDPVQKTMVSELAPVELRASTLGAFQMTIGLISLPSSLIAGILWDKINPQLPFYFSAATSLVAMIILFFTQESIQDN